MAQQYTFTVQQYSENTNLVTSCIDFTIFNNGDGVVMANNFPINPGQTFGLTGNQGEEINDNIQINFQQPFTIASVAFVRRVIL